MRPQAFEHSHPALYRRFMRAVGFEEGAWDRVPVLPETRAFIVGHLDMTLRSWLEALGAVGPGHEWAIPRMFPISCGGSSGAWRFLRRRWSISASTSTSTWSMAGRWRRPCSGGPRPTADLAELRRGARRSLAARAAF
jgi:pyrroloquinoline-quinone synthase